ncbi:unnamed protein product, partial [Dracunculus medinensis]|uniref:C2H2-type domain-containing protein n=1 Tax=Dracunculus medinensis TaxID=318479 RepID=A0A0N4U4F6_DRAME
LKGKSDYRRRKFDYNRRNTTGTDDGNEKNKNGDKYEKQRSRSSNAGKILNNMNTPSRTRSEGILDLDEPFSESEDDASKGPRKMMLPIPRGRIRTLSGTIPAVGYSPKWGGPTMCLSCLQFFDLPDMIDSFAEHLLVQHHIVVSEMDLIVDLKRYVEHWRQRFAAEGVENIFLKIEPDENSPYYGLVDYYFEMSEQLPEDYSLRQRLAMRRLEEALACQQREREDTAFFQQCIFCRYIARGNRSKIIHHLYMIHHLNLGSPDNLVFIYIYIFLNIGKKIFLFLDRATLMDHMRKRNHREVNPKNNYYDKFYIINYLELGKRWLDVLAEDFEDTMPTFVDSDEEEEQDSWHEWQEDNLDEDQTRVLCLLCDNSYDLIEYLLKHLKDDHHFDILQIIENEKLDVYGRVKMINYIRKQNYNVHCFICGESGFGSIQALRKHLAENNHLSKGLPDRSVWHIEENLVPIFSNDHLLWMLESLLDERALSMEKSIETVNQDEFRMKLVRESEENTVLGVIISLLNLHFIDLIYNSSLHDLNCI